MTDPIAFIDLAAQRRRLGSAVDDAILKVVDHGGYIMGPEVKAFEADSRRSAGRNTSCPVPTARTRSPSS